MGTGGYSSVSVTRRYEPTTTLILQVLFVCLDVSSACMKVLFVCLRVTSVCMHASHVYT
jgi:hypothetical protein